MLNHPTYERLTQLRLTGMAKALAEQAQLPALHALSFEERLGLLVDREATERHNRQTASRLRRARLKQSAVAEDIDDRHPRGLDRALFRRLLTGDWVRAHQNVLLTGPTGVGSVLPASLREFLRQVRYGVSPAYWVKPRPRADAAGDGPPG